MKRLTLIQIYVAIVAVAAVLCVGAIPWHTLVSLPQRDVLGLAALVGIGVLSERLAISLSVPKSASSITFLPFLTAVVLFGPAAGVVLLVITGYVGERLFRKKEPIRVVFNISQWVLGTCVSGAILLKAVALKAPDAGLSALLWPFFLFAVSFLLFNQVAVSVAISLSQDIPIRAAWRTVIGRAGGNFTYDLLIAPVAFAVAFLYAEIWLGGLAVSMLPLLFIRASYLNMRRLEAANQSLLKALVKAIETRDPYTSGHSLRVANLSRRIAEKMRLGRGIIAIETAALLHDVGKIDPVYVEILRKPTSLSHEERQVIESHVTKGVELLTGLGAFSDDIIQAVRHHHERMDGRGYPDRLLGEQIPLGARIIKVSDAIDAMLSDRPYRKALTIKQVFEQLSLYAGSQFDAAIVDVILQTDLLHEYILANIPNSSGPLAGSFVGTRGHVPIAVARDHAQGAMASGG